MKDLYRLYIDEVGNHDMKPTLGENERFLSLFGVIVNGEYMADVVQPDMRGIKRDFFQQDPDEPVIFHRKDIARFRGAFSSLLGDKEKRQRFGDEMLVAYEKWQFVALLVTIDKLTHLNTYSVWRYEPYHYCLATMLERYALFLNNRNLRGDVMIEARGTQPDQKLARSFRRLMEQGTNYVPAERFQECLTSKEIKIKTKQADIAGLQLADLLAHPAHYVHLAERGLVASQTSEYARRIALILNRSKFDRNPRTGIVRGYGTKFLP
jgi:hypothetical protein